MALTLPKDSFLALAAIGWADGVLAPEEGIAFVRGAKEAGLSAAEVAEVESYTKKTITIPEVETIRMTRTDRVITYALATWLATLDGVVTDDEKAQLKLLGDRLGLPQGVRDRAEAASVEVTKLPAGARPDKYDFGALEGRLKAKLGDLESDLATNGLHRLRVPRSRSPARDLRCPRQARLR